MRDISHGQFIKKVKALGFEFDCGLHHRSLVILRHPEMRGSVGFLSANSTNRHRLAEAIRRLEEVRAQKAARDVIKAAWDAEFSQRVEPNFVRERDGLVETQRCDYPISLQTAPTDEEVLNYRGGNAITGER